MEKGKESDIVKYFSRLYNLYYLMVGIPLLMFAWVFLNLEKMEAAELFSHPTYRWAWHVPVCLIIINLSGGAFIRHRRRLKSFLRPDREQPEHRQLEEKVKVFYHVSLQKYLMLSLAGLLAVVSLYLSGLKFYAAIYGVILLILSISRPTPERLGREVRLPKEEREKVKEELKVLR